MPTQLLQMQELIHVCYSDIVHNRRNVSLRVFVMQVYKEKRIFTLSNPASYTQTCISVRLFYTLVFFLLFLPRNFELYIYDTPISVFLKYRKCRKAHLKRRWQRITYISWSNQPNFNFTFLGVFHLKLWIFKAFDQSEQKFSSVLFILIGQSNIFVKCVLGYSTLWKKNYQNKFVQQISIKSTNCASNKRKFIAFLKL